MIRVYAIGRILSDGGTLFVVEDAPALSGVEWSLTGNGALTPLSDATDENGVASARYDATGTSAGNEITVEVSVYA